MDVLGDILRLLRTEGHIHGRLELRGPFGFSFPTEGGHFLIVTRGTCFLTIDGKEAAALEGGDFVFLPTSKPFSLSSSDDVEHVRDFNADEAESYVRTGVIAFDGGAGARVSLVSGCFTFPAPESYLLIEHLPAAVYLQASGPHATPWTNGIVQLIVHETTHSGLGATAVIDRLAEVLFVHALREHFGSACPDRTPSWLRALTDPRIGPSIRSIHSDPGRGWTVDELARSAGMSRSAFAARFKAVAGTTPLEHLTRWRMARAAGMMTGTRPAKLDVIAAAVGYESESSFRKAFREVMGASPSEYRGRVPESR
ncbi:MAG: AraC family transcriptional regulator [Xanthobacteraceae bacterium]|nr:AraC family transcriptional regulator [Xanthobacteraceae bacterium]